MPPSRTTVSVDNDADSIRWYLKLKALHRNHTLLESGSGQGSFSVRNDMFTDKSQGFIENMREFYVRGSLGGIAACRSDGGKWSLVPSEGGPNLVSEAYLRGTITDSDGDPSVHDPQTTVHVGSPAGVISTIRIDEFRPEWQRLIRTYRNPNTRDRLLNTPLVPMGGLQVVAITSDNRHKYFLRTPNLPTPQQNRLRPPRGWHGDVGYQSGRRGGSDGSSALPQDRTNAPSQGSSSNHSHAASNNIGGHGLRATPSQPVNTARQSRTQPTSLDCSASGSLAMPPSGKRSKAAVQQAPQPRIIQQTSYQGAQTSHKRNVQAPFNQHGSSASGSGSRGRAERVLAQHSQPTGLCASPASSIPYGGGGVRAGRVSKRAPGPPTWVRDATLGGMRHSLA